MGNKFTCMDAEVSKCELPIYGGRSHYTANNNCSWNRKKGLENGKQESSTIKSASSKNLKMELNVYIQHITLNLIQSSGHPIINLTYSSVYFKIFLKILCLSHS